MTIKPQTTRTKLSTPQLEEYIRTASLDTQRVVFLRHVDQQMRKRNITKDMALETLRKGKIKLRPELDTNTGDLKCRMEHFVAGHNTKMVVAISDEDPRLILVTAI